MFACQEVNHDKYVYIYLLIELKFLKLEGKKKVRNYIS